MSEQTPSRPVSDPEADYAPPDLLPLAVALPRALAGGRIAFFHARRDVRRALRQGKLPFFNHLVQVLATRGYASAAMPFYRPPYPRWIGGRSLHIYRGPGRPRRGPGVLHLAKGYLDGFWYLDPMGQRAWSSIGDLTYDAEDIAPAGANALFREVRREQVRTGHSARDQAPRGTELPERAIAVFLQGLEGDAIAPICSEADMVRAVVGARSGRPVLIKEHPFGTPAPVARAIAEVSGPGVHVVDANVHDILKAASMVATMSSGVGFEALLHRTPALVFSRVDYNHGAVPVPEMHALPELIRTLPARQFNYPKYVWWFLERQLFHLNQPDLDSRLNDVIEAALGS